MQQEGIALSRVYLAAATEGKQKKERQPKDPGEKRTKKRDKGRKSDQDKSAKSKAKKKDADADDLLASFSTALAKPLQSNAFDPLGGKKVFDPLGGSKVFDPLGSSRVFDPLGASASATKNPGSAQLDSAPKASDVPKEKDVAKEKAKDKSFNVMDAAKLIQSSGVRQFVETQNSGYNPLRKPGRPGVSKPAGLAELSVLSEESAKEDSLTSSAGSASSSSPETDPLDKMRPVQKTSSLSSIGQHLGQKFGNLVLDVSDLLAATPEPDASLNSKPEPPTQKAAAHQTVLAQRKAESRAEADSSEARLDELSSDFDLSDADIDLSDADIDLPGPSNKAVDPQIYSASARGTAEIVTAKKGISLYNAIARQICYLCVHTISISCMCVCARISCSYHVCYDMYTHTHRQTDRHTHRHLADSDCGRYYCDANISGPNTAVVALLGLSRVTL